MTRHRTILATALAVAVAATTAGCSPTRTPTGPVPTPPAPSDRGGYRGSGLPACQAEDGGDGAGGPCLLDCASPTMTRWCPPGAQGWWLRWIDSDRPDTTYQP